MPEVGTSGLDGGAGPLAVVSPEVVGDDDLAGPQGRGQDVADVALEATGRHRPVEPEGRADPSEREGGEHGLVLALVSGRRGVRPLPARCARMGGGVPQVAAGLIEPDPGGRIDHGGEPAPSPPHDALAFARAQRLFFRVHSKAVIARLIVAVLTSVSAVSRHQAQCSSSVASACSASRAGNASSSASRLIAGGPGIGFGARSPVARRCFSHRLIVGSETANVSTASARLIPRSTAPTTRRRKSSEYGLIPEA